MKILVTGANGFIGANLCNHLLIKNIKFNATFRQAKGLKKQANHFIKNVDGNTQWEDALEGVDVVVHLAGIAHVLQRSNESNANCKLVNIDGTQNLALQAFASGVKRFVYVSSISVHGDSSLTALSEASPTSPLDQYALSKVKAEEELRKIASSTGLDVVIIRPPLVYGKGVKANFKKLITISKLKLPLPFGKVNNRRSLIYVENLIDFVMLCTSHAKAKNETFLISDDEDVSTKDLLLCLAESMNKKISLLPFPPKFLKLMLCIFGKKHLFTKICGSLYVDITKAKSLLGWRPPYSFKQGIFKTTNDECVKKL